jgi:hypothetical protein
MKPVGAAISQGRSAVFKPHINQAQMSALIAEMPDIDFARFLYCQHIASTHLAVGQFEDMLISAMLMCDRVKLEKALGPDMQRWQQMLKKHRLLKDSTVGSLITILARHDVAEADITYLKWVRDKRDYFVHRLFDDGAWPGDLDVDGCRVMIRRLMAIQLWLQRAQRQIWLIFERAGFVALDHIEGGILATNMGIYDLLDANDG